MSKKIIKLLSCFVSLSLAVSILAGCGSKDATAPSTTETSSSVSANTQSTTTQAGTYPIKTNDKLTYWFEVDASVTANYKNFGETPLAKELETKTGVKVEYIHPVAGQAQESMNILIASNDLPDLVEYSWNNYYNGGPELAISNKVIIGLNDIIKKSAPNLQAYLDSNVEVSKISKTDSGEYYSFPFVRGDEMLLTTYGPVIRGDWLKELNLESPKTIDDWYNVLKTFKEKKGATAPLSYFAGDRLIPFKRGIFIGAFGVNNSFYNDNGKIKYGPAEAGYKDFLTTMAKWYSEGLLDKNFSMNDQKSLDAQILNGLTGATICYPGSGIGKFNPLLKEKNANALLEPTTYPVLKEGDPIKFTSRSYPVDGVGSISISNNCKNIELAAQWLDYGYTEEGNLLYNFGIEGTSYNMDNGYPKMTDEVLNNPDKLSVAQAWAKYARGSYTGPFVQRKEYIEQYYVLPEQKNALKLWGNSEAAKNMLPPISPSKEQSSEFGKIMNDVNNLVSEFTMKVIMGNTSVDEFAKYVEQLNKMNISKAIEIQQEAFDRFNKR